jgi:hypothetical protein
MLDLNDRKRPSGASQRHTIADFTLAAPSYFTMNGARLPLLSESPPELGVDCGWMGPLVVLWRHYRDGAESEVVLPRWIAECTLAAIPECEPDVARAKVVVV